VFWCESRWNPAAQNPSSGAAGVAQLMPFWWNGSSSLGWRFNPYRRRANLYHAHLIFRRSGFHWTQWSCKP